MRKAICLLMVVFLLYGCTPYTPTTAPLNTTDQPIVKPTESAVPSQATTMPTTVPKTVPEQTEPTETLPHVHDYYGQVIQPGCETQGYTQHTCGCGDTFSDSYTEPLGHDWNQWQIVKEATSEEEGLQHRTCLRCAAAEEQKIPKLPEAHSHAYKATVIAPTCTEAGYTVHQCTCGDSYRDTVVTALGHSFGQYVSNADATCTKDGTKTAKCIRCDAKSTLADAGSALGHQWSEWQVVVEPTTQAEGLQHRICLRCAATEEQKIPKLPEVHSHAYKATVIAPTCTEAGYTVHQCTCGDSYRDTVVTALGHSFGQYVSNADATCTKDGTKTAKCLRCDAKSTLPDTNSALGHQWSEWQVVVEPTTQAEGLQHRTCLRCAAAEEQKIPKLPEVHIHAYTATVIAPTCTEAGYTVHQCTCGDSYRDTVVTALGHSFGQYVSNADATCTKDGTKTAKCLRCDAKSTLADAGSALGHQWREWQVTVEPTTEAEGEQTRTCVHCNATDRQSIDQLPPAHVHAYKKKRVAATCTEDGYNLFTCECGDSYREETTKATGHTWSEWTVTKEPTLESTGEKSRACEACDAVETALVEMLQVEGGFVILSWSETVLRNEDAHVTILGTPGVEYDIDVHYSSGESTAKGLENKVADETGIVTWVWHVGGRTAAGTFRIVITGGGVTQTIYFTVVVP